MIPFWLFFPVLIVMVFTASRWHGAAAQNRRWVELDTRENKSKIDELRETRLSDMYRDVSQLLLRDTCVHPPSRSSAVRRTVWNGEGCRQVEIETKRCNDCGKQLSVTWPEEEA